MREAGVKIKGLNSTIRALRKAGTPDAEIKAAGKDSGEIIASTARGFAPVRTGKLRDSIRVSSTLRKVSVVAGNNRTTKSGIPYANPIHWGWAARNIKPQPFFIDALKEKRDQVQKVYFDNLDRLFKKLEKETQND